MHKTEELSPITYGNHKKTHSLSTAVNNIGRHNAVSKAFGKLD